MECVCRFCASVLLQWWQHWTAEATWSLLQVEHYQILLSWQVGPCSFHFVFLFMMISLNLCFATWPQASSSFLFVYSVFFFFELKKWWTQHYSVFGVRLVCGFALLLTGSRLILGYHYCNHGKEIKLKLVIVILPSGWETDKWDSLLVMKEEKCNEKNIV